MTTVQEEDCKKIGSFDFIDWNQLSDATVLITGSTGLIGSNLVSALAYNSQAKGLNTRFVLLVRDTAAAERLFGWTGSQVIHYNLGSEPQFADNVDYIVHLASPTSSRHFVEKPADTLLTNIEGTRALLEWSRKHPIKKFVDLSTMEVYGRPEKGHKITESEIGSFSPSNARNSYPISKIACEALCNGYYVQHNVPTVVLRATQTFGPGVRYDDNRVFAEFMRCAIEKRDITLRSLGLTERPYLYTADAVTAILVGMLRARAGEAYTVANPDTYCSIAEMANMVAERIAASKIRVRYEIEEDIQRLGYAETLHMDLDVKKILSLGWRPTIGLEEMYIRMIQGLASNE